MKNKVTIIGAGMVGSTTAFGLVAANFTEEIAIIDINNKLLKAQVMDLQQSVPFWGYTHIKEGNYKDVKDSKVVIITCGSAQKEGETRIDLLSKNAKIVKEIMPKIFSENPSAIVIIVTNPVDILTNIAIKMFPKKEQQIFGSGTTLDTARLRFLLGEKMSVNPKSVHAYIVGEHGDSELVLWSTATVGSTALDLFYKLSQKEKQIIFEKAKNSAYAIIAGKQSTYYAIAAALVKLTKSVLFDKKTVYTVSHTADGRFGIHNISLSLPAVIGAKGVIKEPHLKITADEKRLLRQSAAVLNKAEKSLLL
ncbi:MAG: L-lactate dehydrogenase [Clostridia bacterium]|nr:L-lactate dehydrogenase [Clostridia bacterium]